MCIREEYFMKKIGFFILGILAVAFVAFGIFSFVLGRIPDDGSAEREMVEYLNNEVDLPINDSYSNPQFWNRRKSSFILITFSFIY